jgi:hypothetical protein
VSRLVIRARCQRWLRTGFRSVPFADHTLEFFLVIDRVERFLADDDAFLEQGLAECLTEVGVLTDGLGDDMAGAFEGVLDGAHANLGQATRGTTRNVFRGERRCFASWKGG